MRPITSLEPKYLGMLASDVAVDLFRRLLWAEAHRAGIGPALISVSGAVTSADGGIDAEIADVPNNQKGGLFFPGLTRYQIKTGAFSARNNSAMKELFLKEGSKELKELVRTCFEKGGTFVAVLFGSDSPDRSDGELSTACQEFVGRYNPAFRNCPIRILRQNQIAGFLDYHLALTQQAEMKTFPHLRTHHQWGGEIESLGALKIGARQEAFINQVRIELRQSVATHLCVWGEPGIGKTRLLYEATGVDDLSPAIAYFRSPQALEQSGVVDELVRNGSKSAIVVVDDCSPRDREDFWRQLKALGSRVRLVTVQHDPCDSTGTTVALQTPELVDEQVSEIIQQHGIYKEAADRFAPFCGGSPRVADVVGSNLQNNPDDLTRPSDTSNVWDRFIEGRDAPSSDIVDQRRLVLSYLALFKRFGRAEPYEHEARAIAKQVEQVNAAVNWGRFQEIVKFLRGRRILQGETTLYITPRLLHIKLWCDWWDLNGPYFNPDEFLAAIPDTLHVWFYEMFAYAHGSQAAKKTVGAILSTRGAFFKDGLLKTELGANFFLSLAEADTEAALEFLEATIGKQSREELLQFDAGRQRVVWALEKIAVERDLFQRAARLLLRLAEAENNPRISNNATGTFAALYSLGPGRTAPTQAPPAERFPLLVQALESKSGAVRAVALRACDHALNSSSFTRIYGAERRGLKELDLWSPNSYAEWYEAYRQIWELLGTRVRGLTDQEQPEAARVLLKHAFALVQIEQLESLVTATIGELARMASVPRKQLLEVVLDVLECLNDLPEAVKRTWKRIEETAVGGTDFQARLKRQVTLPMWRQATESGLSTEPWRALAEEAIANSHQFLPLLPWLASKEAESATCFGYELGKLDREFAFSDRIVQAIEEAGPSGNAGLLGGYLRAVREIEPQHWLSVLEGLSRRQATKRLFPGLVIQSGLTDDVAPVLARLVNDKEMPAHYLRGFVTGGEIRNLSVAAFESWVDLLLCENEQIASISALELLHHYCMHDESHTVPPTLFEKVLFCEALFEPEGPDTRASHRDYNWSQVARKYLTTRPGMKLVVAKKLLDHMGKDSAVLPRSVHSHAHQLLSEIAKELPREVWAITASLLGPPIDARAFSIRDWLGGALFSLGSGNRSESVLTYIPLQDLWDWVEKDVDRRAWYLAGFAPKDLANNTIKPPISRELLIRYGDRDDVQRNLIANFSSGGWMGPESEHYKSEKEALESLLATERQPQVREWLSRYVGLLEKSVEQARIEEEREDR